MLRYYLAAFIFSVGVLCAQDSLYINEFVASNSTASGDADNTGEFEDWIEIYNADTNSIDLGGYYISDDWSDLLMFQLDSGLIVPAGGFLRLWASGEPSRGSLHTNFRLSAEEGEAVILTASDGIRIVDSITFGPQQTDVSMGRVTDGASNWGFFKNPTPESSNNLSTAVDALLEKPIFSMSGGFYDNPLSITFSSSDTGVTFYYTLDGSEPDTASLNGKTFQYKNRYPEFPASIPGPLLVDSVMTHVYEDSISIIDRSQDHNKTSTKSSTFDYTPIYIPSSPINKGTVVKAIACRDNAISSPVAAESYFIGSHLTQAYDFPIVSLSIAENYLFDYNEGIYCAGIDFENWRIISSAVANGASPANYHRRTRTHEYPGFFEYFDENKTKVVGQKVGLRIHGGWTRSRSRKSLRIYARNQYGKSTLDYPFYPQASDSSFKRLLLRNSGNDANQTFFRDAAIHMLVKHLHFDYQYYQPTVVFINGEYWGLHNIREWQERHYINRRFGLEEGEYDLMGANSQPIEGTSINFDQTRNFIDNNDLSNDSLFADVEKMVDIEDFTDYVISQVYIRNTDWPVNNIRNWRKNVPYNPNAARGHDGRWRWLLYDTDFGFGLSGGVTSYTNNTLSHARSNGDIGVFLRNFWDNEKYVHYFVNRYADLMNTCFLPSRTQDLFDSIRAIYAPHVPEHIDRWALPETVHDWNDLIDVMNDFAENRPSFARNHIRSQFSLSFDWLVEFDVSDKLAGYIRVNTIDILPSTPGVPDSNYPWTGIYFQGIPIELTANPNMGYVFSHWEVGDTTYLDPNIQIDIEAGLKIVAHFGSDTIIGCDSLVHNLANCPYVFDQWDAQSPPATYPENARFVYFSESDPDLQSEIEGNANGAYNLTSRTRIIGLGDDGIAFVNTASEEGNPGYPGTKLGGMLVNVETTGLNEVFVQWTGGTFSPESREYNIRLQYRIGNSGSFIDFPDGLGNLVEYKRNINPGHAEIIGPYAFPSDLLNRECVQLLWRYYYTGDRNSSASGSRDFLRLDDIFIAAGSAPQQTVTKEDVWPSTDIIGETQVKKDEIEIYATTHIPGTQYHWEVDKGHIINGQATRQISVRWDSLGFGYVRVALIDTQSCVSEGEVLVAISPGMNIALNEKEFFKLFPNPNSGRFTLDIPESVHMPIYLQLMDSQGRILENKSFHMAGEHHISTDIANGSYYLRLFQEGGGLLKTIGFIVIRD